jgi:hypothetical protein
MPRTGHVTFSDFLTHLGNPLRSKGGLDGYENPIYALCLAIAAYRFAEPLARQNGTRAQMKPSSLPLFIVF